MAMSETTDSRTGRARVILYIASSLDGYIADREGGLEWLASYGGPDEDFGYGDLMERTGALAMGSATYEFILNESSWPYEQPAWVFTRRELPRPEDADLRFVSGPPAEFIAEMSAAAGEKAIWLIGGGDLIAQFLEAGLLDEVIHFIVPKALGEGVPLYPVPVLEAFEVDSVRNWPSGMIELRYRPAPGTRKPGAD